MKKVYLETFGCQMNVSDSERVISLLQTDGYTLTNDEAAADVILLNTCSVREKAENKLYTRIGQIPNKEQKKIGVLGCVAQLEGETLFRDGRKIDFVVGTQAVGRVSKVIERVFSGEKNISDLAAREDVYDWSVAADSRHSPYIGFVPIIEGCNKFCTYCIVPFSRGRERSLPAAEIIRQVLKLKGEGVKEVHLIGQNVNSYRPVTADGMENFRGATPFSRLLRAVARTGIERVKFNTSFPRDFHADIVDAIDESENLCNWVHLPVQSGSNKILRAMRRGHTIENYLKRIEKIKSSRRNISLSTDIIVGFPGETEQDFADTLELAETCRFDSAYIFKYSPRYGTPAYELEDDVTAAEKKERFLRLEKITRESQKNALQKFRGKTVEVLAEKTSGRDDSELTGHTSCHRVVNFSGEKKFLGKIVKVRITSAETFYLRGEIVE